MKKYKKLLTTLLAAGMVVTSAGCNSGSTGESKASDESKPVAESNDAGNTDVVSTEEGNTDASSDADNPYGGLVKLPDADDPITFKFFIRDPSEAPSKDNPVLKKITELTGVTIEWEFLVGDLEQKVGVMIAGEDYPDAIFAEPAKFVDAGAFIPVDDLLPKYPLLNDLYDGKQVAKMTAPDGNRYILELYGASEYPSQAFTDGGVGFFIQKDVLADAGYVIPHTLDEYFKLIEDYQAKYPEIDGVKTIGFEILCDGWRDFCLRNPAQHLMGAGNDGDVYVDLSTMKSEFYQISDTAHDYYKKLNEEYHKGLIEAETFTESYDQYIGRISSGAVLGFFDQGWDFAQGESVLKADGKDNRTYVAVPIANPGVRDSYLDYNDGVMTGNNGIGITTKCKDPERLMEFFDYLLQKDVQTYLLWGEEGKDWNTTSDGGRMQTPERRELMKDDAKKRNETGHTLWNYCPKRQGFYADGTPCTPDDSADEYLASLSEYDKEFLGKFGFKYPAQFLSEPEQRPSYYPVWSMTIEEGSAAAQANTKMNEIIRRAYPQLILAEDDAKFESIWSDMLKQFEEADLQPYLDEVDRQIATFN